MASLLQRADWLAYWAARYVSRPLIQSPAVFHITHYKAGSQWIHSILRFCCPERLVPPRGQVEHFLHGDIQPGQIYPTVYCTKRVFDSRPVPAGSRRFVVIRDLRDTLVSWYFSAKHSHDVVNFPRLRQVRTNLEVRDVEEGLLFAMRGPLRVMAQIQLSWLGACDPVLRYEDLLGNDEEILERTLLGHCQLPISPKRLRLAIRANRFEVTAKGRQRGIEDRQAHLRKGVAGDWRNHFTDRVKEEFKQKYGEVLIATGYESDMAW